MTPMFVLFNLTLFLIWRFRMVCLHWMFDKSNLAILRYPEFSRYQIEFSNRFDEEMLLYYDLNGVFFRPIKSLFGVSITLYVYDPVLYSLLSNSKWINKIEYGKESSELMNFLMSLLFRIPSSSFILVDPRLYAYLALDVYALMYLFNLPLIPATVIVAVSWLGLYRFLGAQLLGTFIQNVVSKWIENREFGKLLILGLILLPFSTADALVILSILEAKDGKNWDIEAKLVCNAFAYDDDATPEERFLYELKKLNFFDRIQREFINKEARKAKRLIVELLNGRLSAREFFRTIEKDTKNYINRSFDPVFLTRLYIKERLKQLPIFKDLLAFSIASPRNTEDNQSCMDCCL